jgi:carbohydrate-selective porin OprB
LGFNWSDPSDGSFDEQVTSEVFYRFQLFQNLAFTPSVQFIDSPSFNPEEDFVWVGGIRGRMTF